MKNEKERNPHLHFEPLHFYVVCVPNCIFTQEKITWGCDILL